MQVVADPVWPVVVLALVCLVDAALCLRPVPFIARCLTDVRLPRAAWRLLPPIKVAAALGLVAGIWLPVLGLVTGACLVLYFAVAISMHVAARDLGRNLFVNALGMLLLSVGVTLWCFVL